VLTVDAAGSVNNERFELHEQTERGYADTFRSRQHCNP
jgi:hypothetical protein